jgi:hypothetical protein
MKRTIYFAFMLFSLMSCEEKCPRVENKDLERCILEYDSIVKSKNDSPYILEVYVKNLNDSVKRFEVSYTMNIYYDFCSNAVLYKVKDKDVLFNFTDSIIPDGCHRISEDKCIDLMKKNFPELYKSYLKNPTYRIIGLNDDASFILTFYKDKLVGKTYQFVDGSPFYKIGNKYFFE